MAYTVIPDSEFAEGQPVKGVTGLALRDNVGGLAAGDTGAPKIQTAALDSAVVTLAKMASGSVDTTQIVAAAVGRSEIATSTATAAGSISSAGFLNVTLNAWSFFPMIHASEADVDMTAHTADGASPDAPRFALQNNSGSSANYDIDHRYIITA